jgi:dihydropteroate synthase
MAREIICKDRPLIMGVLNVTPDSFYDGGKFYAPEEAIKHALKMVEERADIIDVGGESTRPFSERISPEEELKRVIPVIEGIRAKSNVVISIDTYKTKIAKEAVETGADMVNDISGLRFDKDMAKVAGELGVQVIIMHMKGTPEDMQEDPYYDDVICKKVCNKRRQYHPGPRYWFWEKGRR